jgi:ATP-dependent Clp protease ATP-binding subunit ClpX
VQSKNTDICSFCGKHKDAVAKLIVSDAVAICNECVDLCGTLLQDEPAPAPEPSKDNPDPIKIKEFLDQYVIGQDSAKIVLAVAIANHYKRINSHNPSVDVDKVNVLIMGPTGSGKTLLARTVARYLDVPFVIADATSLTEAGYVGDDVESVISRLYAVADQDVSRCERGIVFIDEIDKIARRSESANITRDVSGEGVQQALLKLVEGTRCRITPQGGRKHPAGETVEIDTRNILFIAGGAFVGLDAVIRSRTRGTSIGFGAVVNAASEAAVLAAAQPDDLIKFGVIPEFIGRFPTWVTVSELSDQDMMMILCDVKHNYLAQYSWLFDQDGIELKFTKAALEQIVANTRATKTGARGLRSELEKVLLPHMYRLHQYRYQGIKHVEIDIDLVNTPMELKVANETTR